MEKVLFFQREDEKESSVVQVHKAERKRYSGILKFEFQDTGGEFWRVRSFILPGRHKLRLIMSGPRLCLWWTLTRVWSISSFY